MKKEMASLKEGQRNIVCLLEILRVDVQNANLRSLDSEIEPAWPMHIPQPVSCVEELEGLNQFLTDEIHSKNVVSTKFYFLGI